MCPWNENPLEPIWTNFQEKYLSSTIQQLPWKIKQINLEASSKPSWESYFWEKLRFSIEMQYYHPKWKANIQVSFFSRTDLKYCCSLLTQLGFFPVFTRFFFSRLLEFLEHSPEEWLKWISSSWRQRCSSASAPRADQLPPPPLLLLYWGIVCHFQLCNID